MTLGTASAAPTKEFFVRTLIRDISLDDCVLDLVDNSIDSAREIVDSTRTTDRTHPYQLAVTDELARFRIELVVTDTQFSITDNCGGISFTEAVETAFTFGRLTSEQNDDWSVAPGSTSKRSSAARECSVLPCHGRSRSAGPPSS